MKKIILTCMSLLLIFSLASCELDSTEGQDVNNDTNNGSSTVEKASEPVKVQPTEGEGDIGDYHIKIVGAEKGKDYGDDDVLIVTYEWTNNSDEDKMFSTAFSAKAFQNGIECSSATIVDGVDANKLLSDIKPGASLEVQEAYELNDDSDVTIEVTPWIDFSDDTVITKTFSVK